MVGWLGIGEELVDAAGWHEFEHVWEHWGLGYARPIEFGHVGETNLLDKVGGGGELGSDSLKSSSRSSTDVSGEALLEEVPVSWSSVDTEHGNKVSGVNSISKELESKAWGEWVAS